MPENFGVADLAERRRRPRKSGVARPCALAGPGASRYPLVADIDKDGQPGGVTNPSVTTSVEVRVEPSNLLLAYLFFGDEGFARLVAENNASAQVVHVGVTVEPATEAQSADIDCDGDDDVVFATFESLSCILQGSDGVFGAPTPCALIGGEPNAEDHFKLTDLSGDQCPEIVSVSTEYAPPPAVPTGLIQVFPNNGSGIFLSPSTISVPNIVFGGNAVGDIDGDKIDEVAVISGSSVSLLRRTAPNTLTPLNAATGQPMAPTDPFTLSQIPIASFLHGVQLTDLNADGRAEIVVSNLTDVFIRSNVGNGAFGPNITLDGASSTRDVAAADVNGDGTADIFAVNSDNGEIHYWPSTGPLQWGPRIDIPTGTSPSGLVIEDIDGDGHLDLMAVNRLDGDAVIYTNSAAVDDGTARFFVAQRLSASFPVGGGYTSVASGDFDGDGHPDIAASTQRGDLDLFRNRADGTGLLRERDNGRITFNPFVAVTLPAPPGFAGDGRDRIGAGILNSNRIVVLRFDATLPPSDPYAPVQIITSPGNTVTSITSCDLNSDGIIDIAVTLGGSTPAAQVFLGDALGLFGNPVPVNLSTGGWDQFIVPRVDSGLPANRYYIADYQTGTVLPLDYAGGAFTAGPALNFGAGCTDFALGDIEGDDTAEMVAARSGSPAGTLVVRTGLETGTPTGTTTVPLPRSPVGLALGDINGDGRTDVVVSTAGPANQNQYVISILNSGDALDPGTALLHPAGERPARPLLVDLHAAGEARGFGAMAGPEVVVPNRDATGFQFNASVLILPNQIDFAPPPLACLADFNADGVVNTPDLTFFIGRFRQAATPGSPAERADFNNDGTVNTPDLTFFLGRFGQLCPR